MPDKIKTGRELVGLLPAAGSAERISPLPCSKEIFPVGFFMSRDTFGRRPKTAAHYLLENMQNAGAEKAFIVIRKGKWDIPAYFGGGEFVPINIAYMVTDATGGVPFTLDKAYSFYKNDLILLDFQTSFLSRRMSLKGSCRNKRQPGPMWFWGSSSPRIIVKWTW